MSERVRVDLVAGARPNFMKLAPVERAIREQGVLDTRIVHSGQHYDSWMNDVFFSELGIPAPSVHLGAGSGTHGAQTARILESYERLLLAEPAGAVVVFGDVNTTVACALAAVKLGTRVAHVEAGLRSFDRSMPEEINRVLTDAIADCLLVSEPSGIDNLRREGVAEPKMHLVGNVMIDTLLRELERAQALEMPSRLGLAPRGFGLVTLHRPSNVDDPTILKALVELLIELGRELPLVFPVHPRSRASLQRYGLMSALEGSNRVLCLDPVSYCENLSLMEASRVVLTDSGGMQEETTVLGVPCLTLRANTERPITVEKGTSRLVGNDPDRIRTAFMDAVCGDWPAGEPIPLWDGHAGERIATVLAGFVGAR